MNVFNSQPLKNNKKIAVVSDAIYPFNKGGKEKRIYEITTRLAAQGYDITIYTMKWWDGDNDFEKDNIKYKAISPLYDLYSGERRSIRQSVFFAYYCFKLLREKFEFVEVDQIPHPTLFTIKIICLLKRKTMITTWHEVWGLDYWIKYLGRIGYIAYIVEKISIMLPDTIISVSNHTTERLINILGRKKGIVTISNGVNFNAIQSVSKSNKIFDLVFAGRLLAHKNVDILLRSISIVRDVLPNISLLIIGNGPEKNSLENLVKTFNLEKNVTFYDFIEEDYSLYSLIKAAKIFVLPSVREGFGIVVIEANACGLPVITINDKQNAAKDLIINDQNGVTCNLDADQIAKEILRLLNNRSNEEFYTKYAKLYDWNNIILDIKKIYEIK